MRFFLCFVLFLGLALADITANSAEYPETDGESGAELPQSLPRFQDHYSNTKKDMIKQLLDGLEEQKEKKSSEELSSKKAPSSRKKRDLQCNWHWVAAPSGGYQLQQKCNYVWNSRVFGQ